jgi:Holliday junction DNA helicase RuvA
VIARLAGVLVDRGEDFAVVDVHGVGYLVHLSAASLLQLPPRGGPVLLRTITHVREDALDLYGFLTEEEEGVFRALIEVKGVGPRAAQKILSGIPPRDLAQAVAHGDVARLTKVPGVGKKTAERLVVELKDKLLALAAGPPAACSTSWRRRSPTSATSRCRRSRWRSGCATRPRARRWTSCCARPSRSSGVDRRAPAGRGRQGTA